MSRGSTGKLLLGLGIGAGLGLLFAPKKGSETRKELKSKLEDLYDQVRNIDKEEVKENIVKKIDDIKKELSNLDKEKVSELAKKQAVSIQHKAEDLYKYAVKKGTPVLEQAVDDVRNEAIKLTKEITKKLEASKKEDKKSKRA